MALHFACLENFTTSPTTSLRNPSDFGNKLKSHFQHISPTSPRPAANKFTIPKDLDITTHVFIRHDAVGKPLQPPYHGPYPIVKQTAKHFTIKLNDRTDNISIDGLKPAHLDSTTTPSETSRQQTSTASPLHYLHLHLPQQHVLEDKSIFPPTFHTTCKTLGGGGGSYVATPLQQPLTQTRGVARISGRRVLKNFSAAALAAYAHARI